MFKLFNRDPVDRIRREYYLALEKALQARRNGKIQEYSQVTAEANELKAQLEALEGQQAA